MEVDAILIHVTICVNSHSADKKRPLGQVQPECKEVVFEAGRLLGAAVAQGIRASGHQATQDEVGGERRRHLDMIEAVLQQ